MNVDPTGELFFALLLGITALVGMGLTIGGVVTDNNTLTAIGLTLVAIPAIISGGMAIAAGIGGATFTGIVGGITVAAGLGTSLFATAEYQQAITGNNWMLDAGMSEGWYNGLMLTFASIATLGTFASSFCYSFKIKAITKIGKISGVRAQPGFPGIRYIDSSGAVRSIEFHTPHNGHGFHLQLNTWWLNKVGYEGQFYRGFSRHFEFLKFWRGWF